MRAPFTALNGKTAELFTLKNAKGTKVAISSYGACIVGLWLRDKFGHLDDIVLGYDTLDGYLEDMYYMGVAVGPCPGRISGAAFTLDGVVYNLDKNESDNHLHGGRAGFSFATWAAIEHSETQVTLYHEHKHLDSGYPGNMKVWITYALDQNDCLSAKSKVISDRKSIFNITYHPYFNLKGEGHGDILNHQVSINASQILELKKDLTPSGKLLPVEGSKFDLRTPKTLKDSADVIDNLAPDCKSYDGVWVVDAPGKLAAIASVYEPTSGRRMDVRSDMPAVVFYIGDFLNHIKGKGDKTYNSRYGLCLEPQYHSDAINHSGFPSIVIEENVPYEYETQYMFSTEQP